MKNLLVSEAHAAKVAEWIDTRGGVAIWRSINLSDPGKIILTPLNLANGSRTTKPHPSMASTPEHVVTSMSEVDVSKDVEVKRFRIGIRVGDQGLMLKVTEGGSRRIGREVAKAGEGAYHTFDYDTQEAIIMKPEKIIPLTEWMKRRVN